MTVTSRAGGLLEIDLGGIVANWRALAARAAPAMCAAVVKANAYGLGAAPAGRALAAAGCALFFVATLDEGIALRRALARDRPLPERLPAPSAPHPNPLPARGEREHKGTPLPACGEREGPAAMPREGEGLPEAAHIAVLNGPLPDSAREFVEHRLIPVLNEPGQIAEWRGMARRHGRLAAMLQVDTGMARLGLTPREFERHAETLHGDAAFLWRGLLSHLACADTPAHPLNEAQRQRFGAASARFPGVPGSLAASSGIFLGPAFHHDLVRPGAALYGVNPQPGRPNPMRQVVRLSGKILQIREIDRGEPVGYGAAHVMAGPGRLATVAI
ncbi:MAG: alanine racemase, partial [Acetobacteraceae bacterium]|nr:alanine racemase [Acetobacteraceae bacterium]